MMEWYKDAVDVKVTSSHKKNKRLYSDDIYTFDIETTSMFRINDEWQPFIYDDSMDYDTIDKAGVPYIWMFGINDKTYYGREFYDFMDMLKLISNPIYTKIIWVHNLSFEMSWLEDILKDYTIEEVVARANRKPIQFYIKELNILFRCSYMLTNLSLENSAKEYTKVAKRTGDLDYNVLRSPLTELTETELGYCEYDIITLREVIKHFRGLYKSVCRIPLTSTSRVRDALRKAVDVWYIKKMQSLIPSPEMYLRLWYAFAGGYTHANVLRASKVIRGLIKSKDLASSYPTVMVTEKYPSQQFRMCKASEFLEGKKRESYAYLLRVKFTGVRSKFYNHYLQFEKVKNNVINPCTDNGRIVSCDECEYWLTDIDFDIMQCNYIIDKVEILECYKSFKKYLDRRIIRFILSLYGNKTKLKGFVSDDPEEMEYIQKIYQSSKANINGLFGMSVTSIMSQTTDYTNHNWSIVPELDPNNKNNLGKTPEQMLNQFLIKKLDDSKDSYSTLFQYSTGVWVTSYARRNLLYNTVLSDHEFDRAVIYMDTDSIKYDGDFEYIFEEYNKNMVEKYKKVIEYYPEFTLEDFMPEDRNGVKHPIGFFEDDGEYTEFITHGAKKYCYRSKEDGELHITVSGVSKKGVKALNNDISNFTKDFKWGYSTSGKLIHRYFDEQPDITFTDCQGHVYTSHQRHSVVLYPTSYTLGITEMYERLVKQYEKGLKECFIK
jgi:hypothetical protein